MSTTINSVLEQSYSQSSTQESIFKKFIGWCNNQGEQRLLWVGLALTLHGCFLVPITILIVSITGFNFSLVMLSLGAMAMALIVNLAALPTKITIPVFILSIVTDLAVIGFALA